jgi:LysR family transcriptional regulator, glycine cleavage system transcriptional activator
MRKIDHYPPFNVLRSFLVVTRCRSFTVAARELFLSQSAVSRHIQQVEEYFGYPLFERQSRAVIPTAQCNRLIPLIEELIATAQRSVQGLNPGLRRLTVRVAPTFARLWLLPRLANFYASTADTELVIDTAWTAPVSFGDGALDAAIEYGRGRWDSLESVPLMREHVTPFCSPQVAAGPPPLRTPDDLARCTLLHSHFDGHGWAAWLQEDVGFAHPRREHIFDTLDLAFTAAVRGHGVAIGDINLAQEHLANGTLVRPFERSVETGSGYYLVYPPRNEYRQKLAVLLDWLHGEIEKR